MPPYGLFAALGVFALMWVAWRLYSRTDTSIPRVSVRLDTIALCATVLGALVLTVIALWR